MKKLLMLGLLLFFNIQTATAQDNVSQIVSSQGFTAQSFLRGVLGMFVLILISYILSANRKAIALYATAKVMKFLTLHLD